MTADDIFRNATLAICGNLEIEKALHSTLILLREVMPVDQFFLEYYDRNFQSMRTIASAMVTEYKKLDLLTPLSSNAREVAGITDFPENQDVFIFENPWEHAISTEMLNFHQIASSSLMTLLLKTSDKFLGVLVLNSEHEQFTPQHADIISTLREPFAIAMSNALKHREVQALKDLLTDDNRFLHQELHRISGDEIVGANFGLRNVMHQVRQVAPLDSPVLIFGETGVGKDVIANAIHYGSSRSKGPLVSVNCGAIPESLVDSELFGHEKGSFTGAITQKRGRFERADTGTIFLDEISELPPEAQVRLLRVLQNREIERVGGTKTIPLDIRIIAATNRNLQEMVRNKDFREDLWFRLNVFPIWIPPLRDRKADIPALLQHFILLKSRELKLPSIPSLAPGSIEALMDYYWPGNVRELQNIVERALILHPNGPLTFDQLITSKPNISQQPTSIRKSDKLDDVISSHIKNVLARTNGKIHGPGGAAELLGINANTLRNRMNKLGIRYKRNQK